MFMTDDFFINRLDQLIDLRHPLDPDPKNLTI